MAFLVAFCCLFFQNSTFEARLYVGYVSLIVAALVMWCIVTYWKSLEQERSDRPLVQLESEVVDEVESDDGNEENSKYGTWEVFDIVRRTPYPVWRCHSVHSERTPV